MRHGSLFSGIGGFDLASEWMGWENVFHCEWMEFPRKVLDYYWPNADSHIDICKTDFKKYANTIDIITGGFPCQPFSTAGKRKGTDDERYLWGEMLRAIQEIKPKFVIAENVFGITNIDGGLVFEQVCLDLESEGYEVQPFIIPAAGKNAPHRRDRCWFVAFNTKSARSTKIGKICKGKNNESIGVCKSYVAQNPMFSRCVHGESEQERAKVWKQRNTCARSSDGLYLSKGNVTDTGCSKWQDGIHGEKQKRETTKFGNSYTKFGRFTKFPTQSPICSGDDGLPTELDGITFSKWRAESIKGYGNAIVPQVAYEIFKQL
jgi:DNA (cytosine-5)-methyltransferase 1